MTTRSQRRPSMVLAAVLALLGLLAALPASAATLTVRIDLSQQTMDVQVDGAWRYSWPVSTARRGYRTPTGEYRPIRLERSWYSRKYDNAPMPHSIFFLGGYAIHGTNDIKNLGRPVSHGCVRLHPDNAATLFALVKAAGMPATRIVIRP